MVRSIYLGGGITMLRGFPERLEAEIAKLVPTHLTPKVSRRVVFIEAQMNDFFGSLTRCTLPRIATTLHTLVHVP
jgi:actin-related protein